jgi:hypothetical protein
MTLLIACIVTATLGAAGGLMKSILFGFEAWTYDSTTKVWRPGWIGHLIIGAVASVVVWAIYGPFAGQSLTTKESFPITLAQAGGSLLVGIGGAEILRMLTERRADAITKLKLNEALKSQLDDQ